MKLLLSLSLRNLLRQKRRNLFLGIGIGFGVMVLIIITSFTSGVTDTLLNKMMVYASGHISLEMYEDGSRGKRIIRDKSRMMSMMSNTLGEGAHINEAVAQFVRVIGNRESESMVIVGTKADKQFQEWVSLAKGSWEEFTNDSIENPVILTEQKAESLNVGLMDQITLKTRTIYGQSQAVDLTVVALVEGGNAWMSFAGYTHLANLKRILNYAPYETMGLQVIMENMRSPKTAVKLADDLHAKMQNPDVLGFYGSFMPSLEEGARSLDMTALGFFTNEEAMKTLLNEVKVTKGSIEDVKDKSEDYVMISQPAAARLNLDVGDEIYAAYKLQFEKGYKTNKYQVGAIYSPSVAVEKETVFMLDMNMYDTYNMYFPKYLKDIEKAFIPAENNPLHSVVTKQWKILPRTQTTKQMQKKFQEVAREDYEMTLADVSTMYENFEVILSMEFAVMIIALVGVVILFFIILIGVFNTLRMSIRERTREIGTTRAVGMQQGQVATVFVLETTFLAFFASVAGVILSLIIMQLTSLIPIHMEGFMSIFFYDDRIHYLTKWPFIVLYMVAILIITAFTSYLPSSKAAKMKVADALRHFE